MAEVMLDGPRVVAIIGKLVAAAMPQHVAVDEEAKAGGLAGPRNHALIAGNAERRAALTDKHVRARHRASGDRLPPLQLPQCSALAGPDQMHAG